MHGKQPWLAKLFDNGTARSVTSLADRYPHLGAVSLSNAVDKAAERPSSVLVEVVVSFVPYSVNLVEHCISQDDLLQDNRQHKPCGACVQQHGADFASAGDEFYVAGRRHPRKPGLLALQNWP